MATRLRANWAATFIVWAGSLALVVIAWSQVRQAGALERLATTCAAALTR